MNTTPVVSIIVAVKNETDLLLKSVSDLLKQTYKNFEIIIVDDGSGPATKEALATLNDSRIRIITLPKSRGQAAARMEAMAHATGSYIAIADSDDRYSPLRIEHQLDFMEIHPHIQILGCSFDVEKGKNGWDVYQNHDEIFHQMLVNNPMVHSALFFNSDLLSHGFHYKTSFDTAEDYEVLAHNRKNWIFHNLKGSFVTYNIRKKSNVASELQKARARIVREKVLLDYLPRATDKEKALHHDFCELTKGRKWREITEWVKKIVSGYHGPSPKSLRRILYRQAWRYLVSCKPAHTPLDEFTTARLAANGPAFLLRNIVKIIIRRPL